MRTVSPILQTFSSSCAAYFFERRMNFLYSGCMMRRLTKTVTVLSILSLVTRPVRTRLAHAAHAFGLASRLLEAQVELLLPEVEQHRPQFVAGLRPDIGSLSHL